MSACPIPDASGNTLFASAANLTTGAPDASDESCNVVNLNTAAGTGTPITITGTDIHPAGPIGPVGPQGPEGSATAVCGLGFQLIDASVGWVNAVDYILADNAAVDCDDRTTDIVYIEENDSWYACRQDHTSEDGVNGPPGGSALSASAWGPFWSFHSGKGKDGLNKEEKSWFNSLVDHFKNIADWDLSDWAKTLAIGAGLLWLGSKLEDAMAGDGEFDGSASTTYTGSNTIGASAFTAPLLSDVLGSLCESAGLTSAQYDTSALASTEIHFTIGQTTNIRNIIEKLSLSFQFDLVDTGGVLKFVPKNTSSVKTLTTSDLGFSANSSVPTPYVADRMQGVQLPNKVTLTYIAKASDYNSFVQTAELQTFPEGREMNLSVPITLSDQQAKDVVDNVLVNALMERMRWTFSVSYEHLELEPGDIISAPVSPGGGAKLVRILEITEEDEGVLNIVATEAGLAEAPTPILSGSTIIGYTSSTYLGTGLDPIASPISTNTVTTIGYSAAIPLDLPALNSTDKEPRIALAVHGYGLEGWPGAAVYCSEDGGVTYDNIGQTTDEATWGIVASSMASPTDGNYAIWDEATTFQVELKTGTLTSKTEAQVLAGANRAMVNDEMIGFKTATLVGTGPNNGNLYDVSGLLRGVQGTEWSVADHVNAEPFVLIDDSLLIIPFPMTEIGKTRKYKFVTYGSDLSKATAIDIQILGKNLVPWRVANPVITEDLIVTGTYNVSWTERAAFENELADSKDITRDPDFGGWAVVILNPVGEAIMRTEYVSLPTFDYTTTMQIEDFGSTVSTVTCRIFAISTRVGRGYGYQVTGG